MKKLKITAAIGIAGLVAAYYLVFGILYLAGFRLYRIPTAAMQPTIQKGEKVIGRLSESYRSHAQRFDVVVFKSTQAPGEVYTKRIVGLSGERITIDEKGVMIDGHNLQLPSVISHDGFGAKKCDIVIPPDAVFVLGDYTPSSMDSRYLGPIPKKDLIGYLVFKK